MVISSTPPMGRKLIVVYNSRLLKVIRQLTISCNVQSIDLLIFLFIPGENLVSKPSLQVQATGEGKGNG